MSTEVRQISDGEAPAWTRAMFATFAMAVPDDQVEDRLRRWGPERTLGAFDRDRVVGTFRSFPTSLSVPGGGEAPVAAITNVGVLPSHRRRGLLTEMMARGLADAAARGEVAAVLGASEYTIYPRFGFGPAAVEQDFHVEVPTRFLDRPGLGPVELVPHADLRAIGPELARAAARGRPGSIPRFDHLWDHDLGIARYVGSDPMGNELAALYTAPGGAPEGFVRFTSDLRWAPGGRTDSTVTVHDLTATTPEATAALWRFVCSMDLVRHVSAPQRPADEPLPWLVADGRAVDARGPHDNLWLRVLDVAGLLSARTYAVEDEVVLAVADEAGHAAGRWLVAGGPDGATCTRTERTPDVALPAGILGAVSLGAHSWRALADAGVLWEQTAGAVARADRMFRAPLAPWCPWEF